MRFARPIRSSSASEAIGPLARCSNGARGLVIFSFGLFTIAGQSLLFREFITTFEGNDISVGIFFGSWFLWVGLGATLVYRVKAIGEMMLKHIELVFLSYVPVFALQLILIVQARRLAGIESYALWSVRGIVLWSVVINSPVSVITGLLFPSACRWIQGSGGAVSRVYIIEAAGSFVGGIGATILLGLGASAGRIFLVLALIICVSVFAVRAAAVFAHRSKARITACALSFAAALGVCACLASGVDRGLMRRVQAAKWRDLLGQDTLIGSFQTPQAEYLYGTYQDQWVAVREGSVCEALPDESTAGQTAAISLCQNPGAESVLVVGSGLGLCRQMLRLPQIKDVTWAHPDTEYARLINDFIPPELRINDSRFNVAASDVRTILAGKKQCYDIVILNLPDATSSVLNRYYTLEFYAQIKESLRPGGILAVRASGGENIMGTELINLGASIRLTLTKVFAHLLLTPGEETWFIASDGENLTGNPATLRDRFAGIEGAGAVFSADALLSIYLPDRADAALECYSNADLPERLLINRDARPLTYLYGLLLTAKQSGAPLSRFVKLLSLTGLLAFLIPILVFVALRGLYILTTPTGPAKSGFDSSFLVFSAGWVGIGTVIVLMYLYQTYFGSLYLHVGIISSLFMAGLTIGAALVNRLLRAAAFGRDGKGPVLEGLLLAIVAVHISVIGAIAFMPGERWGPSQDAADASRQSAHAPPGRQGPLFAGAFVLCGLCAGCYFPVAARRLADCGFEAGQAGGKLGAADHLGASAGGVLTSLALVPVLGTKATLLIFVVLMLANIPSAALTMLKPEKLCRAETGGLAWRRLGYILFAVGAVVVLCSNLLAEAGARLRPSLPRDAAQALAGELGIEGAEGAIGKSAGKVNYFKVYQARQSDPNAAEKTLEAPMLAGYIFSSEDFAPEVRGFGGKMNLAVYVDTTGKLIDFHIVRSNETPSYLDLLAKWRQSLIGRVLFEREPFGAVDAVSGATVSCKAILSGLQISGHRFAGDILGVAIEEGLKGRTAPGRHLPDSSAAYLIGAFALALIVIYLGEFWTRLGALVLTLVLGGVILNAQYSSEQIATLLSLQTPAMTLTGAFLLAAGVPLAAAVFGNIYCGYICPFGAAQELLGYIIPARFKQPLPLEKMRQARFIKYAVLFVLVIVFFLSRDRTTLAADPLISVFSGRLSLSDIQWSISERQSSILVILAIILLGSLFYTRFWCRYLCPAGAFLSLFNKIAILKRILPAKRFGRCEFGLTPTDQLDCLYCDRCRHQVKASAEPARLLRMDGVQPGVLSRYLVIGALAGAIFVSAVSVDRFLEVMPASADYPGASLASGGQPRDVDLQRIRKLIQEKKLSDHEAEFYKKLEEGSKKALQ